MVTQAEWNRIQPLLDDSLRGRIRLHGGRLCPLLDLESGACTVYQARPIACRTYGFYADREAGLYCAQILERVEAGEYADVLWGNQERIDVEVDQLGVRRTLAEWLAELP
jgi:uncharacterized protein